MEERQANTRSPLSVFISYAHEDEPLRQQLESHLSLFRHQGLIADWHDRQIMPGADWAQNIEEHLETATIILLLVSSDFLNSEYCYDIEMKRALERQQRGEARVIPIILRPVDWHEAPFGQLQCLPPDGRPVTEWDNWDLAFREITRGIRRTIKQMRGESAWEQGDPFPSGGRTHRQRLMKRIYTNWIVGVLDQSLHHATLLALGLQEQPDALANPWRLTIQEMSQTARPLPEGTRITQVYDTADGELLILGEPGAGKTTFLLQLARDLLERAEKQQDHPVPVVFNLSSWATKRPLLAVWLVEELHSKYQLSREVAASWIKNDRVILLLDGLDEVVSDARADCVKAINAYLEAHDLTSIVVCSRSAEYFAQTARLFLQRAVTIDPLTHEQIETYLTSGGEQLKAVLHVLHDDLLQELTTTPLMLSILTLAYYGKVVEDLPAAVPLSPTKFEQAVTDLLAAYGCLLDAKPATQEAQQALLAVQMASEQLLLVGRSAARRQRLFATYVERMLHRRTTGSYTVQHTIYWLSWMAKTMLQQDQTIFSLEMNIDKLANLPSRIYLILGALLQWLFNGLIFGTFFGLLSWLASGSTVEGLIMGLISIPVAGIVIDLIIGLKFKADTPLSGTWSTGRSSSDDTLAKFLGRDPDLEITFYRLDNSVLRWYLYRAGVLPWNYRHFLDYATECLLLRKVGDGYIFVHRSLLEYFASLEKEEPQCR